MFEGFKHTQIQTTDPEVKINLRYGGNGPPILLIHGNPLTHVHWHLVAPRLAQDFTVVVTDLRGYGDSDKPRGREDHSNYSFRRMGQDQIDVMAHLGFNQVCVAGHDRGARTAVRMALEMRDAFPPIGESWKKRGYDLGLGCGVHQRVLQAVGVKRPHGLVVLGRHHDADHAVAPHHPYRLALGYVDKVPKLGFGFVGGEGLHGGDASTNRSIGLFRAKPKRRAQQACAPDCH